MTSSPKVAIITGASRGIGAAIAMRLADEGYALVLAARSQEPLQELSAALASRGAQCRALAVDLGKEASAEEIVTLARTSFGRIDVIVANAGAARHGSLLEQSDAHWFDGFSVKLFSHARIIKAAWPELERNRGSVVMIGGVASRTPAGDYPIGSALNAAVIALAKSLADFGRTTGVRVNAINPGQIRTERLANRLSKIAQTEGISMEAAEQAIIDRAKIMQIGEPSHIAETVAFLADRKSQHITGAVIEVDGGMTKGL